MCYKNSDILQRIIPDGFEQGHPDAISNASLFTAICSAVFPLTFVQSKSTCLTFISSSTSAELPLRTASKKRFFFWARRIWTEVNLFHFNVLSSQDFYLRPGVVFTSWLIDVNISPSVFHGERMWKSFISDMVGANVLCYG